MIGFCIIPEGRRNKDYSSTDVSEIYNVSVIKNLNEYLEYANTINYGTLYISIQKGLIFADDLVSQSPTPLYKYSLPNLKIWSKTVAEQIYRECLNFYVSSVCIMINHLGNYKYLIEELKKRGIRVYTPFLT